MNYCTGSILEARIRTEKYHSMDALKQAIFREWVKIPEKHIRAIHYFFHWNSTTFLLVN